MERGRGRKLVNLTWRQEGEGVWGGEEGEEQECYDRLGSSSPSILGQSCFSRAARWICGKHLNKSWWRNLLLLLQSSTARRWSPLRPGFSSRRAASPLLLIWRQVSLWILSSLCIYIYGGLQLEWSLSPQPPIVLVCLLLSLFTSFSFFICLLLLPFTQQLCRLSLPFFIWLLFLLSKPSGQISFSPSFLFFLKLSQLHGQALWSLEKYLRRKGNGNPVPRLSCFQMSPFFPPSVGFLSKQSESASSSQASRWSEWGENIQEWKACIWWAGWGIWDAWDLCSSADYTAPFFISSEIAGYEEKQRNQIHWRSLKKKTLP